MISCAKDNSHLSLDNSTDFIIVIDGGFGLFHAGFQFSEAIGNREAEPTAVLFVDGVAPAEDVALHGTRLEVLTLVEKGIGGQSNSEAVVA